MLLSKLSQSIKAERITSNVKKMLAICYSTNWEESCRLSSVSVTQFSVRMTHSSMCSECSAHVLPLTSEQTDFKNSRAVGSKSWAGHANLTLTFPGKQKLLFEAGFVQSSEGKTDSKIFCLLVQNVPSSWLYRLKRGRDVDIWWQLWWLFLGFHI